MGKVLAWVAGIVLVLVIIIGFAVPFTAIFTAPGRVITDTLGTKNIIQNYEMFFDINAGFNRRLGDIKGHETLLNSTTAVDEKNRLNIELVGLRQICRELANQYDAESHKLNKEVFKSSDVPAELDPLECDK
jgi:hypothetical protein